MKKLLICLSLILVLVMVFVACKKDDQTPDDTTTTQKQETPTPTECDHQYGDEWLVDSSVECANENRLYKVCSKCGEKVTQADTCAFGEWVMAEGKVCADADRKSQTCTKCGKVVTSADGACTYGEFVDVVVATCEEDGLKEAACTKCGDKVEITVDALGHKTADGVDWKVIEPATCTTDGIVFGTCVNCDVTDYFTAPAFGHSPIAAATCTDDSICGTCNAVVAEATGHSYTDVAAKEVSCTEDGYVAGTVCTVCGDTNGTDYALIPALGHKYTWTVTVEPTFATTGEATAACERCDATDTTVVPAKKPELLYSVADFTATEDAKVTLKDITATPAEDGTYVTLTPTAIGAYLEFLTNGEFSNIISIKYRVNESLVDFGGARDGYFTLNGVNFFGSVAGDNAIDYNNEASVGEWTILNIDLRKNQVDLNGVEYDVLDGAAITAIKYVLFAGYEEGASIDVAYIAFFDEKVEASEFASVNGPVVAPHLYVETDKSHTTTLGSTNGAGDYGAPGKFLNTNENKGATVINWNGRFYNNFNLKVEGTITVEGGVQKLVYSFDGGVTWLEFAEGAVALTTEGNVVSYVANFDLTAFAGKTVDLRIAAILGHDEEANITEILNALNIKKINVVKADANVLDVNLLAAAGNQADKTTITATVVDDYVHYTFATGVRPTVDLINNAGNAVTNLKKYMLIQFKGNGSGYGQNYDFYLTVNGTKNSGGQKYQPNWFNMTFDNTWNYIIVDITNGGAIDISAVETLSWTIFDSTTINESKGNWLDVKEIKFFDTYDEAKAIANPNGDFISTTENGSTITNFTFNGISADNSIVGNRTPGFTTDSSNPILLATVNLMNSDTKLHLSAAITSNVAIPGENVGIKVGDYDIVWTSKLNGEKYEFNYTIPADFVLAKAYPVSVVVKSATNSELILVDTFVLTWSNPGLVIAKDDAKYPINDANIAVSATTIDNNDVVALYKDETLIMYYSLKSGVSGFKANGGNENITIVDQTLAKLATAGTYTVKLHFASINGGVADTKEILLENPGIRANGLWTAEEVYTHWSNFGGTDWGANATLSADKTYVTFSVPAQSDGGRIFLLFAGFHWNTGWNTANSVGGMVGIKYRNTSSASQINICWDGCLCGGGAACDLNSSGTGWIGASSSNWYFTARDAWVVPSGYSAIIIRLAPGMTIDIESIVILDGYQDLTGPFNSHYGIH